MDKEVKETLQKQLQLLSARSKNASDADLVSLTNAMCEIADRLPAEFVPKDSSGNLYVNCSGTTNSL